MILLGNFLYGSQNYCLDTPDSDKDYKMLYIPSYREIAGLPSENVLEKDEHFTPFLFSKWYNGLLRGSKDAWELPFSVERKWQPSWGRTGDVYFAEVRVASGPILRSCASDFLASMRGMVRQNCDKAKEDVVNRYKYWARAVWMCDFASHVIKADGKLTFDTWREENSMARAIRFLQREPEEDPAEVVEKLEWEPIEKSQDAATIDTFERETHKFIKEVYRRFYE